MARSDPSYFSYLPIAPHLRTWGFAVSAAGYTVVPPATTYPPAGHPADRHFNWRQGRLLACLQVVYLTAGRGRIEWTRSGHELTAGDAFILYPGVWHRYRPDPAVGWTEHWIEMQGPVLDDLAARRFLPSRIRAGMEAELNVLFERCHHLVRAKPPGFQTLLGPLGMQILAQLKLLAHPPGAGSGRTLERAVARAQNLLGIAATGSTDIARTAQALGVDHTAFRRAFKRQTGLSPKQYAVAQRIRRAQIYLADPHLAIQQIARTLGYSSAYHFSADFRARTSLSPSAWRQRLAPSTRPAPPAPPAKSDAPGRC